MKEHILFVDDDHNILEAYKRKLRRVIEVHTAQGPHRGLQELEQKGPFAVVVADMNMPIMNGIEFLQKAQEISPETVRMMLTGNADIKTAMQAVNEGAVFRFLTKPCPSQLMGDSLVAGIRQYRLILAERELLEGTLTNTAELLTEILSWVSPDTFGRTMQLRNTALTIGEKLQAENLWEIGLAATLSQLGIMALPSEILTKAPSDALSQEDRAILESVPSISKELIERIPRLEQVANAVLYQDKRYDGAGYPDDAVKEKKIPLGARILKVAKDFHGLRGQEISRQNCLLKMKKRQGYYDPRVLAALDSVSIKLIEEATPTSTISVPLSELRPGVILAASILTNEGRKLIAEGTEISDALYVRLKKFAQAKGIQEPIEIRIRKESEETGI